MSLLLVVVFVDVYCERLALSSVFAGKRMGVLVLSEQRVLFEDWKSAERSEAPLSFGARKDAGNDLN